MSQRAVVLADFTAESDEEISVPKNAFISVVRVDDDGWCTIEYNGNTGLFPSNYLNFDVQYASEDNDVDLDTETNDTTEDVDTHSEYDIDEEQEVEPETEEPQVEPEPEEEEKEETPEERAERKEAQRIKQRNNIINEIRDTESDYVKDLQIIVEVFNQPLLKTAIIPQPDIVGLFSNIAVLLNVNQKLNDEISASDDNDTILVGKIFVGMVCFIIYLQISQELFTFLSFN